MTDDGRVLTRSPNAAYRIYDGQATIVLPDGAKVIVLNECGSLAWESFDGSRTVREVVDKVVQEFDVDREVAEKDIHEFITALQEQGMVG